MTETEWSNAAAPQRMLDFLHTSHRLTGRKFRLFFCACSRRIWPMLAQPEYRTAVEVAERFADTAVDAGELQAASEQARQLYWREHPAVLGQNVLSDQTTEYLRLYVVVVAAIPQLESRRPFWQQVRIVRKRLPEEALAECDLLRELFRPRTSEPAGVACSADDVQRLAQAAYDERRLPEGTLDNARLALLATALETAGCSNVQLLAHLRSPDSHYRGCFALDAVLGKS